MHLSLTFSRLLGANPASHIAAHHAAFAAMHLQGAIDFAVLPILARRGWLCTKIEKIFMPINKVFELGRRAARKDKAARVNPRCPVVPVSRLDAKNYLAGDEK